MSVTDRGGIAAIVDNDDLDVGITGDDTVVGGLDNESESSLLIYKLSLRFP